MVLPLAAYADRLSARPGESLDFKVSNRTGAPVTASVVRVISADPNPAGPGIRLEPVRVAVERVAEPGPQEVQLGSCAVIDLGSSLVQRSAVSFVVTVMPTLLARPDQVVATWLEEATAAGLAVTIGDRGLVVQVGCATGSVVRIPVPAKLEDRRWYRIVVRVDGPRQAVAAGIHDLASGDAWHAGADLPTPPQLHSGRPLMLAGSQTRTVGASFNGRIEAPMLVGGVLTDDDIGRGLNHPDLIAGWDFAQKIETFEIVDVGPSGLHGRLVNAPTRAVTGSTWTGREMSWRHAPDQYAAVHFHEDDIDDCRWPTSFRLTVPDALPSGSYALMLKAGEHTENVPFFVVPPKGRRTADIAVLVSTFTYTVYANHARPEWMNDAAWQAAWRSQSAAWNAYPHNPGEHRDYGLSTYNYHTDGSGISLATWRRPILNLRIGYLTYPYPDIRASGLRHYPADSHLTSWLEAQGYRFDIITDWELHTEGHRLLADYPVVLTGSHPEYHTREMLEALTAYRDGGGRFCYLGGNGFYWKVALAPDRPGLIEIRRGEGGIRAWAADPGEYYNQFDGEYGGLWRRNGRPPQKLTGVGFTAQGNFVGSFYRLTPEARGPRVAWMFRGIDAETIGGYGLSGHGAAGFELDRTDKRLGTPGHALVVGRSEDHPPEAPWVLVPEEQLTHITTIPGQPHRALIHADLTFFETAGGKGAVFSTGSITFCGSLPHDGFDNDVSRLLRNVVDRFLDPTPFTDPRDL